MTDRTVPAVLPSAGRFDLARWFRDYVQAGDVVHFPEFATYWTEQFTLQGHPDGITIQGHGATLTVRNPPARDDGSPGLRNWNRPFEVIGGNGLRVFDLNTRGCKPIDALFNLGYEGQTGFAFLGAHDSLLCRCASADSWGDGLYIADYEGQPNTNLIACAPTFANTGRNGVTTVGAEGVLIVKPTLVNIGRTGFNLEVHPERHVRRYEVVSPVLGYYRLNLITSTGSGESSDVTFRDITIPTNRRLTAVVAGAGAEELMGSQRAFGLRRNWRIEGVRGGLDPKGRDKYVRLLHIDGLKLVDVPYPMQTTGSRLV